jgi:hypothetical protein
MKMGLCKYVIEHELARDKNIQEKGVLLEDNQMNEMLAAIHPNGVEVDSGKRVTRYNYSRSFITREVAHSRCPPSDPARHLTVFET